MLVVCWWLMPLFPSNTGSSPSRPCCPFHCEQILHHPSFFVLRDSDSESRKYMSDWLSLGHIFLSLTLTHCSIFLWFILVHQGLTHNDHSPQALLPSGFHWLEQCKVLTGDKRVRRERSQAVSPPLHSFSLQCRNRWGTPSFPGHHLPVGGPLPGIWAPLPRSKHGKHIFRYGKHIDNLWLLRHCLLVSVAPPTSLYIVPSLNLFRSYLGTSSASHGESD